MQEQDELKIEGGKEPFSAFGIEEQAEVFSPDEGGETGSKAARFFDWAIKLSIYLLAFLLPLFFLPFTSNVLELNKQFLLFIFSFVLLVFWLAKVNNEQGVGFHESY